MSKFSFYTDIHFSGQTPRNRLDDYPATLLEKLKEVYCYSEEQGCDFVIFGGDMFHTHRIYSYDVMSKMIDIISSSKLNTFSIIGQHDLRGYNRTTFDSSAFSFIINRCENFEILWEEKIVNDCLLTPSHVWDNLFDLSISSGSENLYNVLIAHHLLTNKKAMFDIINTKEFVDNFDGKCPFQLVLSGDLHDGYDVHKIENTWFCNPGSLSRRSISDINRMPQIAIVDTEQENPVSLKILECGQVGKEVFNEEVGGILKVEDFNAENFIHDMESLQADFFDIHDLIRKMGIKEGISNDVLSYLDEKRKDQE